MFINIPENFSTSYGELIYKFQNSTSTDLKFTVKLINSDEIIGVKKLYNTEAASINVAPLVRNILTPKPQRMTTTFSIPDHTSLGVSVTCNTTAAEVRYFTAAKERPSQNSIMTTLPLRREIKIGDQESILIHAAEGVTVGARIVISRFENSVIYRELEQAMGESGVMLLNLNTSGLSDVSAIDVDIFVGGSLLERVTYTVSPQNRYAYRLAWVSSAGSIEHFTFPRVMQRKVLSSGKFEVTLVSDYESQQTIDALSELLTSVGVWRVDDDEYTPVEVATSELVVYRDGKLSLVELKVIENG